MMKTDEKKDEKTKDEKTKDLDPGSVSGLRSPPPNKFTYKDRVCEIIETLRLDDDLVKIEQSKNILKNRFHQRF